MFTEFSLSSETVIAVGLLMLRLALGIVIFPHGAQKLLGWYGGYGFQGTMNYFTQTVRAPYVFGLLAIIAEFFGALGVISGLFTRIAALGILSVMIVAAMVVHRPHGFFVNWYGNQQGEGFEFHILAASMAAVLIIAGAGPISLDALLF